MIFVEEKRRFPRISLKNRVGYVLFNENREKVDRGIGYTLNLSQTGVLLETKKRLEGAFIVLISIDLVDEKVKVTGKVANSRYREDSACFLTGVEFIGPKDRQLEAIKAFVKSHLRHKYNSSNPQMVNWKQR